MSRSNRSPLSQAGNFPSFEFKIFPPVHPPRSFFPTAVKPSLEILALRYIEHLQSITSLNHSLNSNPSNAHTSSHGQFLEFEEVETNTSKAGIGDSGAAEGEFEGF
jgi:hypothetical protein